MRIVQLIPELNEGGVERGTVDLNRVFVQKGHESIVISAGGKLVRQILNEGGTHLTFDACSKNILTAPMRVLALKRILKKIQPDIIHARSRVPAWLAYLANRSLHIPFVTTMHGVYSINKYSEIMTRGDRVICVGSVVRDYALDNYPVAADTIRVIERGVDLNSFSKPLDREFIDGFKQEHRLHKAYIVTAVGRVTHLKDYETFIKAVHLSSRKISNLKGIIVGGWEEKSDYYQKIRQLIQSLGVQENVIMAGSQSKMAEIYALSDISVNLSLTMGNVARSVIESIVMNRPVISTVMEGLDSLIKDNLNGFVVPVSNHEAVSRRICDLYQQPILNVRKTLNQNFTLDRMADKTIAVYKELQ
jgi:glycosyltransferase involved in cell wall biosynthesis